MRTLIRLLPLLLIPSMIQAQGAEHLSGFHARSGDSRIILRLDGSTIELESVTGTFPMPDALVRAERAESVRVTPRPSGRSRPGGVRVVAPWSGGESRLFRWRQQAIASGQPRARRSVAIGFLHKDGSGRCFILSDAWPSEWGGPSLTEKTSGIASEFLDVRFDGLTSQDAPCAGS